MIQSKRLSPHFLAEAINYTDCIVNHTPSKLLKDTTLEEAWSKIKLVFVVKRRLTCLMKKGKP